MATMTRDERLTVEDRIWTAWERSSAIAQNDYHRDCAAAHAAWRTGGSYSDLEAATKAALAARNTAEEAASETYRAAMRSLRS
jgi:hypothetical protein